MVARTMVARLKRAGVAAALAAIMLPFGWSAQAQTCTTGTLPSGSFFSGTSWTSTTSSASLGAGTVVTLTVTGGAGGTATLTVGSFTSTALAGAGSVSVRVSSVGTYSVSASGTAGGLAGGDYAIAASGGTCSTTTTPGATDQQAQNQSTAVQIGQSVLGGLMGTILLRAALKAYGGAEADAPLIGMMLSNSSFLKKYSMEPGSAIAVFIARSALSNLQYRASSYWRDKFNDALARGDLKAAAEIVWGSYGYYGFPSSATLYEPEIPGGPQARVPRLEYQEREQAETLRELQGRSSGFDRERVAELSLQLAGTQDRLKLARVNAKLAAPDCTGRGSGSDDVQIAAASALRGQQGASRSTAPRSIGVDSRSLASRPAPGSADACEAPGTDIPGAGAEAFKPTRWNSWLEGRAMGSSDSLLQNNALGFIGFGGVGYQATPWLMTGLSVGAETFRTAYATPGVGSNTVGVSVVPYAGIRLDQNIQAAAFVGFTSISYNTNPASGVSAQFAAQRYMVGGALTGTWYEGFWRFQPSLQAAYATENQNAYTDSAGTSVGGQTVYYGRIGAGPEIGYTFIGGSGSWTLEPFVSARINLNIASDTLAVVNNAPVVVRPGTLGSGSLGGGVNLAAQGGPSLRFQGSYDSIGVSGLDVWSAMLRGSFAF